MIKYTVWVGGTEVNDYYLESEADAEKLADEYREDGYDDVIVEAVKILDD
jgi:hypothetical protein